MEDASLRNQLAVERTRLANERTFLAYVRTALTLVAGGAAIFHFYPGSASLVTTAWGLLLGGGVILTVGLYRFFTVRAQLSGSSRQ